MMLRPCPQEAEIRRLLQLGHWPHLSSAELRAHAEGCRACGDLVVVTQAFEGARASCATGAQPAVSFPASLPHPGVLWWRAQLRRRNAAVERIHRPIVGAQIFAFAVTLLVAAGFAVSQAKYGWRSLATLGSALAEWFTSLPKSPAFHWETLLPLASGKSGEGFGYLIPGLVLLALLSGVVVYLASEKQ
jgi:hypothetical protein